MSYSSASRRHWGGGGGGGLSGATLLAAKVAVALAAAASLARVAVPVLVSVAGAVYPRVWAAARVWLVPPYLFVTVHLIILVIWKLSDHRHFQAHKDPWLHHPPPPPVTVAAAAAVSEDAAVVAKSKAEFAVAGAVRYGGAPLHEPVTAREISPDYSGGGESCVTTESDEDAYSPASYVADSRRSLAPALEPAVLERALSPPPRAVAAATAVVFTTDGIHHNDDADADLDATWNAIMQKTRPSTPAAMSPPPPAKPSPPPPPPPRARDPSLGAEEMNRRFDDFIKKNRHSFGRQ